MNEKLVFGLIVLITAVIFLFFGIVLGASVMGNQYQAEIEYCKVYFDVCWEDLKVCWEDLEIQENKYNTVYQAGEKGE